MMTLKGLVPQETVVSKRWVSETRNLVPKGLIRLDMRCCFKHLSYLELSAAASGVFTCGCFRGDLLQLKQRYRFSDPSRHLD